MCFICDGGTIEQLFADTRERIDKYGFTMVGVGEGVRSWVYTIGLLETFGHPELVVTTLAMDAAADLFSGLAERIGDGESFDASSRETTHLDYPIRFGSIHPTQWAHGRFAMWVNYYGHRGALPAQPDAVQVLWANEFDIFPPDRDFCDTHRNCQPLLSHPVGGDVNEVQRRRRKKRKR